MSKITRKQLVAAQIINEYDLARVIQSLGGLGVFVRYRPQETGRAMQSAAWKVVRPGFQTDPGGHWRDHGDKTFTVFGREQKDPQRLEAIAWASERYRLDPEDWLPSPFGRAYGWFPGPALRDALAAIEGGARIDRSGQVVLLLPAEEEES